MAKRYAKKRNPVEVCAEHPLYLLGLPVYKVFKDIAPNGADLAVYVRSTISENSVLANGTTIGPKEAVMRLDAFAATSFNSPGFAIHVVDFVTKQTLRHELTHLFLYCAFGNPPDGSFHIPWLSAEQICEFFSTWGAAIEGQTDLLHEQIHALVGNQDDSN